MNLKKKKKASLVNFQKKGRVDIFRKIKLRDILPTDLKEVLQTKEYGVRGNLSLYNGMKLRSREMVNMWVNRKHCFSF